MKKPTLKTQSKKQSPIQKKTKFRIRIFDWYVIREFLKPVFGSLILVTGLLLITRVMDDMNWVFRKDQPFELAMYYWLHHLPEYIAGVMPMALLFATSFTIGNLNKNNELVALMVGGISFFRVTIPIIILGFIFSIFAYTINDTLVVTGNRQMKLYKCYINKYPDKTWCDAEFDQSNDRNNVKVRSPQNEDSVFFVSAKRFFFDKKELLDVDVMLVSQDKIQYRIIANKARFEKGQWLFFQGFRVNFANAMFRSIHEISAPLISSIITFDKSKFNIFLPVERILIKERKFNVHHVRSNALTVKETMTYINELKEAGKPYRLEMVEFHAKFAMPFMTFILTFLGAAIGSRLKKAVIVMAFVQSLMMAFLYILFLQTGKILGNEGIVPPIVAAWAGNFLFFSIGLYLFRKSNY